MTTGEYLVAHSTLPSGTALQHLMALQIGSGQGTVFCSQFRVTVEQPELVIARKAKRRAAPEPGAVARAQPPSPVQKAPIGGRQQKDICAYFSAAKHDLTVFNGERRVSAFYGQDEITVLHRTRAVSTIVTGV